MNIDKFGHHVHKRLRQSGNIEGDIDLRHARLKGLKLPRSSDEATNKAYVDQLIKSIPSRLEIYDDLRKIQNQVDSLVVKINKNYYTKEEITNLLRGVQQS